MPTIARVKAGDNLAVSIQLTFGGATKDITGATSITATIRDAEHPQTSLLTSATVTNTTPATSLVTLTLTPAQEASIRTLPDYTTALNHICDVRVVEASGAITRADVFTMPFTRPITP